MPANEFIQKLHLELPPIFSRKAVPQLMPGVFASQTLANLSSQGKGPPTIRIGRQACYERDAFLRWLERRMMAGEK